MNLNQIKGSRIIHLFSVVLIILFSSCTKNLPKEQVVYKNNFEKGRERIKIFAGNNESNAPLIFSFNNTKVLGPFNHNAVYLAFPDGGLKLDSLPIHDILLIEFDLYIHDQWKGNDGLRSDFWTLILDGQRVFTTTFSNTPGTSQSYPEPEGSTFYPGANSENGKLPGICTLKCVDNGTALYHFAWKIQHDKQTMQLALSDLVVETDTCLKSWSIDNLQITCISFNEP